MHTYFFSCVDDSVIHLSFFERDAEAASILQYNSLLQKLSASSSFVCCFVSQPKQIHMHSPCFSLCPDFFTAKAEKQEFH